MIATVVETEDLAITLEELENYIKADIDAVLGARWDEEMFRLLMEDKQ